MKSILIRLGLLALFISALSGCGGSDGAAGAAGAPGQNATAPGTNASVMTPTQWANSQFNGVVTGVTIGSDGKPVVSFKVTDKDGNPVTGLGNTSQAANAIVPSYTNLSFGLLKLVPGTNGSPSRWVSYIVTSMPTKCLTTTTGYSAAAGGCVVTGYGTTPLNGTLPVTPSKPGTDNTGTLVDNGDGTYKYTFYRSIAAAKSTVDGLAASAVAANANNIVADLDNLAYDANLTHRVGIHITGSARGTGTNTADGSTSATAAVALKTPANVIYDFVPATGAVIAATETDPAKQRNIVDVRNCFTCHGDKFANNFHGGNNMSGIGAARQDTRMCVLCHTDQRKYSVKESTLTSTTVAPGAGAAANTSGDRMRGLSAKNLPVWIHKIHGGSQLVLDGYNATNILFNEVRYPQDVRNCTKCHSDADGATGGYTVPQADNWKNKPNRAACGACHDGIDFAQAVQAGSGYSIKQKRQAKEYAAVLAASSVPATWPLTTASVQAVLSTYTATGHTGGQQLDDASCAQSGCHTPAVISAQHLPVTPTLVTTNTGPAGRRYATTATNLPAGAKVLNYVLSSVTLNASRNPVYKFKIQTADAATPTVFTDVVLNPQVAVGTVSTTLELMPNFTGTTSLYTTFSVPQDGLVDGLGNGTMADWNANVSVDIRAALRRTAGNNVSTVTGPDANGFYTLTHEGAVIPASATNMTGWMGLAYNAIAQTDVAGYTNLNVTADAVSVVVTPPTGATNVARRTIVEKNRCNSCHNRLGVFADSAFHEGQRNNPQACAMCHRPNQTSGGWSAGSIAYIHGIHGGAKRTVPFTWHIHNLGSETGNVNAWKDLTYPGFLRNCQQCHLPNTVNFGSSTVANTSNAKYAYENGLVPYYTVGQNKYVNVVGDQTSWTGATCTTPGTTLQTSHGAAPISPYVAKGTFAATTDYGPGFAYNFNLAAGTAGCTASGVVLPALAAGAVREAAATTLVNSPITNACFGCHTNDLAVTHMKANGGILYKARWEVAGAASAAAYDALPVGDAARKLPYIEQCIICHGAGRVADAETIHSQTYK